jgi:hypothetical protein
MKYTVVVYSLSTVVVARLLTCLCTSGAVYGCLEIHLNFIKVVCFYIISLYNGLADQWGRGGGQRTRDHYVADQCCQISDSLYGWLYL